jgi:hypothetical protein
VEVNVEDVLDARDAGLVRGQQGLPSYLEGQLDPERGIMRVADRRFSLRRLVRTGTLGQLILSLLCFLVGATALVLAINLRDPPFIGAAAVGTPVSWFYCVRLFRRWLGGRQYGHRLIETLDGPEQ